MSVFSKLRDRIFADMGDEGAASLDLEAQLTARSKDLPESLDWKRSISDLLKLVDMDSSYGARKVLAIELGYSQEEIDSKGSAEMNIWLHREVMKKLAESGIKVPQGLSD